MTTPDGISSTDWNVVHELTVRIFNAPEEEAPRFRKALFDYLDCLKGKYGEQPSIVATRADFTEDLKTKEELLKRAYALADRRGDGRNAMYISHSLAQLYIEDLANAADGRIWLDRLQGLVIEVEDDYFVEEYAALRIKLHQLG